MAAAAVLIDAASAAAEPAPEARWREVWAGADVAADVWLVYSGATVAPMGHIHEDGIRFRVTTGYGQYRYPNIRSGRTFEASTLHADVLAGWLARFDPLTVKVFAGASYIDHEITPFDAETVVMGGEWGIKGVVEFWLNMSESLWSSLDVTYTTAHDTGSVRGRSGYRVLPNLSIGLEGILNIDGQAQCKMRVSAVSRCRLAADDPDVKSLMDYGRTGLFARYEWEGGEASVSAGGLGQFYESGSLQDVEPYVTVNWITQF